VSAGMQPYPPRRPGPPPNYTLRRLVAATGVVIVALLVWTLVDRVTGGDDEARAPITTTSAPSTTMVPLVAPPPCAFPEQSEPTAYARPEDWYRTLVDPIHAVPEQYLPPDLVPASQAGFSPEYRIREVMVEDLNRMRNAILAEGLPEVAILAAYRSVADQQVLFDARVAELGFEAAAEGTARPGHSEHHLGTAIDVRPIGATDVDQSFGETPTGQWLSESSWQYGFLVSYPAGVEDVTCYKYEPWHLRYVGTELAERMHRSGLTVREYQWHWQVSGTEPGVSPSAPQPPLPTTAPPPEDGG
jgi:zinc D-Ala-D-Ala carboxypeptidase